MKRRLRGRKRERDQLPLVLLALKELLPSGIDGRNFLMKKFVRDGRSHEKDDSNLNAFNSSTEEESHRVDRHPEEAIRGAGLTELLHALNHTTAVTSATLSPTESSTSTSLSEVTNAEDSALLPPTSSFTQENGDKTNRMGMEERQKTDLTCPLPLTVEDLLSVTRRVPRSCSTADRIEVPELCFALHLATAPVEIHVRRQLDGEKMGTRSLSSHRCEGSMEECEARDLPHSKKAEGENNAPLASSLRDNSRGTRRNRKDEKSAMEEISEEDWAITQYYKGKVFDRLIASEGEWGISSTTEAHSVGEATKEKEKSEVEQNSSEWSQFLAVLSIPLPMTLRIHWNEKVLHGIAQMYLYHSSFLSAVVKPATVIVPPPSAPFSSSPPAVELFGCSDADYHANKKVQYICRTLHSAGAVSFQEIVSALPILVLDVRPHHRVLDLCAAPGSKTLHALDEMLNGGWTSAVSHGVLIASEKERVKATQTLPARLKRYHAPNVLCIRCDGTQWPRLYTQPFLETDAPAEELQKKSGQQDALFSSTPEEESAVEAHVKKESCEAIPPRGENWKERRFDRIICDVPCSGDGTIRKEPSIAATWSSTYVNSLLPTQVSLLRRGLDLLEVGGVLVYSTCSLNPKEDEEVLATVLALLPVGEVEMLNVNDILAAKGIYLHSHGGISDPTPSPLLAGAGHRNDKKKVTTAACTEPHPLSSSLSPLVATTATLSLPSSFSEYNGSKVLRVWPHRDNTGGFFIAAFRKRALPVLTAPLRITQKLNQWTKGKLWAPVAPDDKEWASILSFYFGANSPASCGRHTDAFPYREDLFSYLIAVPSATINDDQQYRSEQRWRVFSATPRTGNENDVARLVPVFHLNPHGGPSRRIVLMTLGVAEMLFGTKPYKGPGVEVVAAGARAFEKYDEKFLLGATCRWRATVETLSFLAPFLSRRTVRLPCAPPSAYHEEETSSTRICTSAHRRAVESLLRHGFIHLTEYWPELFLPVHRHPSSGATDEGVSGGHDASTTSLSTSYTSSFSCSSTEGFIVEKSPLADVFDLVKSGRLSIAEATQKIWPHSTSFPSASCSSPSSFSVSRVAPPSAASSAVNSLANEGVPESHFSLPLPSPQQSSPPQVLSEVLTIGKNHSDSLLDDFLIGGVNVEIYWDPAAKVPFGSNSTTIHHPDAPWCLSATLSRHKLEIAVDGSLRAFGLMHFCGVDTPIVNCD